MIDKEDILERTGRGLAVFKHYINFPVRPGKNFRNPLYEDRIASCNIYYDRHAQVFKMKDFGNNEYSGDCFRSDTIRLMIATKSLFTSNP